MSTGSHNEDPGECLPERLSLRDRLVPLTVAGAFFLQMMDTTILNTSLPQMARTFGVRPLELSTGVTVYMLVFAAMLPLSGWFSERFGARRVFTFSIIIFCLSSVACGLSSSLPAFIAARAVQGFGASMMTPVGRMIVLRSVARSAFLQAMATIAVPALVAPLIGPLLGGILTTWASWRWNFFVNLPVGLLCVILIHRFVPIFPPQPGRTFDRRGFLLSSSALACLLFAIESLTRGSIFSVLPWVCLIWGLCGGAWAVSHLRRCREPLLDLEPLSFPTFRLSTLGAGMWIRLAISSTPFLLPLLFQVGLGLSPIVSGGYLAAYFAGNLAMKSATTAALRRFGFRTVVVWNGCLVGGSILSLCILGPRTPIVLTVILLVFAGLVRSLQFTSMGSLVFADVPDRLSASAATLSSISQQVAMALGVTFAAASLNFSRVVSGHRSLEISDFRVSLVVMAAFALLAAWQFRKLHADAGAILTGRSRRQDRFQTVPDGDD
jgi:MFS family permease